MVSRSRESIAGVCVLIALSCVALAQDIYIWDGTSELAMIAQVTDSTSQKPVAGATIRAVRVGGRNTEPLTKDHPAAMPAPQKTGTDGRATLVAYFRAAGDATGTSVFCRKGKRGQSVNLDTIP